VLNELRERAVAVALRDATSRPEEAAPGIQVWPRSFTFECGDRLPEGEDIEGRVTPPPEEDAEHGEHGEDEFGHELISAAVGLVGERSSSP
jgi:hypothetical protein